MILSLVLILSACSTPDAPQPTAAPAPVPAAAPAPSANPPAPMPPDMPGMAMGGGVAQEKEEGDALPPTAIPDTSVAIVAELKKDRDAIQALIGAGKLKDVHPVAKQVMDLANALPAKAAALPGAERGTLALKCMDIKEKADAMHDAADEGNAPDTKAAFDAVSADIDAVSALVK